MFDINHLLILVLNNNLFKQEDYIKAKRCGHRKERTEIVIDGVSFLTNKVLEFVNVYHIKELIVKSKS